MTKRGWKIGDRIVDLSTRGMIMGVLNVTPDSFSDGGKYSDPDRAFARAIELEEQGADIIDIGAESTKPGSARVTADVELQRLVPVLERINDSVGLRIAAPHLFRSARDLDRWLGALRSAASIEAIDTADGAQEQLRVRIATK